MSVPPRPQIYSDAFLRCSIHQGFRPANFTDITDIFDAADEALFSKILHHPNHLAPLLPNETNPPTHHTTSGQGAIIGNLFQKSTSYMTATSFSACCTRTCIDWLIDNWLTILYFDVCIQLYFILRLSCWAAFCQLRINEYCIVLYCIVLYCIVLYCIVLYCMFLTCTTSATYSCMNIACASSIWQLCKIVNK